MPLANGHPRCLIDMTGQQIGRLTVMKREGRSAAGAATWRCQCMCGKEVVVLGSHMRSGHTSSCGCHKRDKQTRHGRHGTDEYRIWAQMRQRCENPNNRNWCYYGERGIRVCERWHDFANFLADMGERPNPDYSLGRDDHDKDYEPGNVSWELKSANFADANRRRWSRAPSHAIG